MDWQADAELKQLRDEFINSFDERRLQIKQWVESGLSLNQIISECIKVAHKLAGSAKTYGFPVISEVAEGIEDYITEVDSGTALDWLMYLSDLLEDSFKARKDPTD